MKRPVLAADAVNAITKEWARDLHFHNIAQDAAERLRAGVGEWVPLERPFAKAVAGPNKWRELYELEPFTDERQLDDAR